MKKVLLLVFALISIHNYAYATSGACSYHGGVDCSAGAGIYGQAICNDGWTGSSVSYSSMSECTQSVTPYCPAVPMAIGCTTEDQYIQKQNQCTQELGSQRALEAAHGLLGSSFSDSQPEVCSEVASCRAEIDDYNAEVKSYNQCLYGASDRAQTILNQQLMQQQADQRAAQAVQDILQKAQAMRDYCSKLGESYDSTSSQCTCPTGSHIETIPVANTSSCVSDIPTSTSPATDSIPTPITGLENIFAPTSIKTPPRHIPKPHVATSSNPFSTNFQASTSSNQSTSTTLTPITTSTTTGGTSHDSFIIRMFKSIGGWFQNIF